MSAVMNFVLASLVFAAATAAHSPFRPLPPEPDEHVVDKQSGKVASHRAQAPKVETGRAGLPYAFGKRFHTLSQYLMHLQNHAAPIDLPWWRRVGPDRFERVTTARMPKAGREVATRAELMQRYGFTR